MKELKSWVGKKSVTNPQLQEKHSVRKLKKYLINKYKTEDWEIEVYNYKNKKDN